MSNIFNTVISRRPPRAVFDLSYRKLFTADAGYIYPVMCDECVPGDIFSIGIKTIIRMNPLVSPVLQPMSVEYWYFFVPYRLLWPKGAAGADGNWEDFIRGGDDGDDTSVIPTWEPTTDQSDVGKLWDYLGFPTTGTPGTPLDPEGTRPIMFPRCSYYFIFNEYLRDQNLSPALDYLAEGDDVVTEDDLLQISWRKDYFASALPWQQKGTPPSMPVSITGTDVTSAVFDPTNFTVGTPPVTVGFSNTPNDDIIGNNAQAMTNAEAFMNDNSVTVDGTSFSATSVDIATLRLSVRLQEWLEINATIGNRYTEFLKAHFGVSPRDERLDRPEYIGGAKMPFIVSEVLQTSESGTTPQGTLAGHGICPNQEFIGKYRVTEFGLIMGLMVIRPKAVYEQGINRQWLRESKYDFYFNKFSGLSEQGIFNAEIFVTSNNATANQGIFGYQARYNEMRVKHDMVCGKMRYGEGFDFWHQSRYFSSLPSLNFTFLKCNPRKDIFAAPSEPGFIVEHANIVKAVRPMPYIASPYL